MIHPKAALIERLQKEGRGQPQFATQREGPDHEPTFRSQVKVQGKVVGKGEGGNKREAERRAAESALARLDGSGGGAAAQTPAGGGKRKRKTSTTTPAASAAPPTAAQPSEAAVETPTSPAEEPFTGPWPVFDRALAESLRIAHERVDADLRGDVALAGIEAFALRLYKDVLEDLGEVVEEA